MSSKHQSVRDYIAARQAGDADRASQIAQEVAARFTTRTTDGSEAAEIAVASMTIPLGTSA
ncbi:hypothetical protein SLUN_19455 [Streptomyces lunaelactis]|uniref:Uncharacterized protein n=1 Tax=Streptomyces lunaelactis TaxID=1535768 RepID=A0A2R4T4L0_9ACTN|nr:hypothetical protein [Streptomyces lunaelactis]AVZ74014.1 hypothetical protein SLUN_19455 [Streptomyces lunaelactis]NUK85180.1 hypothetical protein [Streptomyces lunaelactis]